MKKAVKVRAVTYGGRRERMRAERGYTTGVEVESVAKLTEVNAELRAINQEQRKRVAELLVENENLKTAIVHLSEEYKSLMSKSSGQIKELEERVAELEKGTIGIKAGEKEAAESKTESEETDGGLLGDFRKELNVIGEKRGVKMPAPDVPVVAYEPAETVMRVKEEAVEVEKETEGTEVKAARTEQVEGKEIKVVTDPNDTKIKKGVHHKPWEAYGLKKTTYYKRKAEGTLPELKVD